MKQLKFIDFCAGIGGGRLGLTNNGLECIGYSEVDLLAQNTYQVFYGNHEKNWGDLTQIDCDELPDFDLLICGFPCQTFSVMGKREGFKDERGQIIYSLINILRKKEVPLFILENVKGLTNHDKGNTLNEIKRLLVDAGYDLFYSVLDSIHYGVPQMRERIYFVGIKRELMKREFKWPAPFHNLEVRDCLIDNNAQILNVNDATFQKYLNNKYNKGQYDINEILKNDYLVLDTRQSDLRIYQGRVPTLRVGRHGILYVKNGMLHKLSGCEGLMLQGFPKEFADKAAVAGISSNRLLAQAGNAMTVNVIEAICRELVKCIEGNVFMNNLVELGSQTARNGFKNEQDICNKFINWKNDIEAQKWLKIMNYKLNEIESVMAVVLHGYKADVNVQVQIKLKTAIDTENIQVKLVSNKKGFNQVDKRWLKNYKELWDIPEDVYNTLKYFTGEVAPYRNDTRDSRRMFLDEMTLQERNLILEWFTRNKMLVLSDIIKGRGQFSAEWVLVAQKVDNNARWVLKNINEALQHYSEGDVSMTPRGSIKMGRVTVQRKGGDGGRDTANMLQFKLDPIELFETNTSR